MKKGKSGNLENSELRKSGNQENLENKQEMWRNQFGGETAPFFFLQISFESPYGIVFQHFVRSSLCISLQKYAA